MDHMNSMFGSRQFNDDLGSDRLTRILIADDSDVMREMIRSLLKSRRDFEVCGEATNGIEAIERTKELKPDLVILDITMPIVDGFEAARVIRKFFPDTRILIFSIDKSDQLIKEVLEIGLNGLGGNAERQSLLEAFDTVLLTLFVLINSTALY
jgi:DNA-binding NarL/FixJ family response regulator